MPAMPATSSASSIEPAVTAVGASWPLPIVPTAAVMSRRVQFNSWDRASLGLPFGRAIIVVGDIIRVSRNADEEEMEAVRLAVERGLDEAHRQGYAMVGASDPGADLRSR